ncbi:MAG TPA: hypothetical protein VIP98_24220 [Microlunatus sp.]
MLYLKTDFGSTPSTDNGTRPYTGTNPPFWDNASIWLDGGAGVTQTSTHVGTDTSVRVRVTNSGTSAVSFVSVDAYLLDPFVGITSPAQAIRSFNGTVVTASPGSGGSSPTDSHVALCQLPGEVPWKPTATELANSTGGHLCLIANVYADGDGKVLGSSDPFDVANNAHHGQRNIALLASTQKMQNLKIKVMPGPDGQATLLDLHALNSKTAIGMGENWLLRSRANVVRVAQPNKRPWYYLTSSGDRPDTALTFTRKSIAGRLELAGGTVDLRESVRATKAAVARVGNADRLSWHAAEGGRIRLAANRQVDVANLTLQRDDDKGSLQAFDIVQRSEDGTIIGGLRVLSLVTGALR